MNQVTNDERATGLNISCTKDEKTRILFAKHLLEKQERKPVSVSEFIRRAVDAYAKQLEVSSN